jgi:serine/threonine protein kinase
MIKPTTADGSLTPEEAAYLERTCDAFEAAWQAGSRPAIEQFLEQSPASVRKELLRELLELDVAYRQRWGEKPTLEEYRRRFTDYFEDVLLSPAQMPIPRTITGLSTATSTDPAALTMLAAWPELPAGNGPAVPGYEILSELGRGGMGVVYKATQLAARRVVALKMIRDGVLAGPEHRVRFRIEAEAAARFQHPNLVRIYEVGEHGGLPYFSMEFAEGGSLDKHLAGQPLPSRRAAELVRTLAEAVQYAHDKKVIHRDLKPANVVLTADGRPLITDFGLAKRLDSDSTLTPSAAILGTASYMAPEQAEGRAKDVGPATDIYALGAILYEVLAGRPPFRGGSFQATIKQVIHEEPVPPTRLRPEVSSDLETICLKCLEKDPEQRYATARDLAEDLSRYLTDEPIAAAPTSDLDRQARWARQAGFEIEDVMTYGVRDAVYKAREVHLNRVVALKVIAVPAQAEPEALVRLRQEAQTVAQLDHPNIVRIHAARVLNDRTYLTFEYVDGGSLIERFVDRPLPPPEAARLVRQLAEAMNYAHQRGVIHCALKPSNVLLTADGVPKITNFGLSMHRDQPEAERRLPFRRLPSYLAPELVDGRAGDVGPATDVYALGAILYKLLTGGPPFLGETVAETLEQVRSRLPLPPSAVQAEVPAALDRVCLKCLAKVPDDRYACAGDLAEDLASFVSMDRPTPAPRVEPLPRFAGHEVLRELGRGSMSIVYEARARESGRPVAIKTFQRDYRYGEPLRALLREVAESVSRLRHPNVVQVYECAEVRGRPYFIMELVTGGSLDRRTTAQLPVGEAAELVRTLARALDTVHRQGIIHGNLKPSKVLLAADGTPKITGFIISRHQSELTVAEQASMTVRAPAVMGTPRYMAPEQLSGNTAAIGPATDVYALGLILYELLTGWLPFRAATLWEMMAQVLHEPPQPPQEIRPDVPRELGTICLGCLAKKPEQRYPSAGALADDLDRFLACTPVSGPPRPQQPTQPPIPRLQPAITRAALEPALPRPGVWTRFAGWLIGRERKES